MVSNDFDQDLARLEQIRRAQRSARPKQDNPAWMNSHTDCDFLLGFIEKLWREYQGTLARADASPDVSDLGQIVGLIEEGEYDKAVEYCRNVAASPHEPCPECAEWKAASERDLAKAIELGNELDELRASQPPAAEWQPIETAPKGIKLIAGYPNRLGKWRSVMACYYLPGMLACDDDSADESGYAPEGWYEESETHDHIMRTDEPPTHWMPLPKSPTATKGDSHG